MIRLYDIGLLLVRHEDKNVRSQRMPPVLFRNCLSGIAPWQWSDVCTAVLGAFVLWTPYRYETETVAMSTGKLLVNLSHSEYSQA